ncbi:MAG: hypothetical protein JNM14_16670 [Ferruginibacter sp.]|nr:hypothetical protein [Ferruginibacter sp.]
MILFHFTGDPYPSHEEQERAKAAFIDKLGPLKDEFENSGGVAVFNYSFPDTDNRRISFNLDNNHSLSDFIIRWNEYIRTLK